jgi:hypothetical protein
MTSRETDVSNQALERNAMLGFAAILLVAILIQSCG